MKAILFKIINRSNRIILTSYIGLKLYKFLNKNVVEFICPICKYNGPFSSIHSSIGIRKHAICPQCNSFERHRLQYLVIEELAKNQDFAQMAMLHFAPEPLLEKHFRNQFKTYTSADLSVKGVDYNVDLTKLPFRDNTYDFIFASHVLEHIRDDRKALLEISRILRPNGIAILPVPILAHKTGEYPEPNPHEAGHVRVPGLDYFDRYLLHFSKIKTYNSKDFPEQFQLFAYEDRSGWPTIKAPLRSAKQGIKHPDFVPVCFV